MAKKITTPNWFENFFGKSIAIGQENQFLSTRGLRYGPLRINKTGIFINNGTLDSTIINNTGFHGYGLAGSEQITLDATTGLNITDGTNSVLQAIISGTNVGDVTIGAYSSGAGVFYDKSGGTFTIKGALTAGSISIGTSPNWFCVDTSGNIWSGAATLATPAPFSVTKAGALTATSGTIGGWTINTTTLSSGSITLDSEGLIIIGSTTSSDAKLKWSGGSKIWEDSSNKLGINSVGGEFYIYTDNTQRVYVGTTNVNIYPTTLYCHNINFNFDGTSEGSIDNVDMIKGANDLRFQCKGTNENFQFMDKDGNVTVEIDSPTGYIVSSYDDISLNGTIKTAIVPTSKGYNALYCTESPEVWFFDFCETKKKIDPMFLEVTEGEMKFIKCNKGYQVWRRRKGYSHKRFEPKTALQFYKNEKFLNLNK